MEDSIGQNKCLGSNCPNHCCSEHFIGLGKSLEYENDISCDRSLLSHEEKNKLDNQNKNLVQKRGYFILYFIFPLLIRSIIPYTILILVGIIYFASSISIRDFTHRHIPLDPRHHASLFVRIHTSSKSML